MNANKTRNELKVLDSNSYRLKTEERMKNGVVAEALAASRSVLRREEGSLTLVQAEAELVGRRVEGG